MSLFERDGVLTQDLLDVIPGGVVQFDPAGRAVALNREALRILGVPEAEILARSLDQWEPDTILEDGSICPASAYPIAITLTTGKPSGPLTIGVVRADGVTVWATFNARPIFGANSELCGAIVGFMEVTELVLARRSLAQSEAKWRALAENLTDFVIVADRDARIVFVNRVLGHYDEAEVIGRLCTDFIDERARAQWLDQFERVLATGDTVRFETWADGPGGKPVCYEIVMSAAMRGAVVDRVVVVARDITDRKEVLGKIAEHERLASVGMLAASVTHEVMNPLTYVLASLDFALTPNADPLRRERAIRDAREGAMRVKQIAQDLRTIGRPSVDELTRCDVTRTFEMALRLSGPEVIPRATVVFDFREVPSVLANEARLAQLFINLLVNAAHAIEAAAREDGRIVARIFPRDDGAVAVAVEDEGVGIAPDALDRIFEPFYTSKERGTGLGLAISREIADRLGAELLVESQLGVGSTFTVVLKAGATTRKRRRVLIVEADVVVGGAIARALEASHSVTITDGLGAATAALSEQEHDALVWSSEVAPDGPLPWAPLLTSHPGLSSRVLAVLTANTDPPAGVPSLRKPFARDELIRALDDLFPD